MNGKTDCRERRRRRTRGEDEKGPGQLWDGWEKTRRRGGERERDRREGEEGVKEGRRERKEEDES